MDANSIILEPIITEKSVGARASSTYVFKVHPKANKIEIRKAIETIFKGAKVADVNTVKVRGKRKQMGMSLGHSSGYKKAYVTLIAGSKIEELEV
ncbi:MAG: 50S ribosomal protein L23 [Candidatus Margulisiibacteriota bacterium]|nr:50S ribosomal protein L23 [Candidatus Margulisiibacteriota bacterium]